MKVHHDDKVGEHIKTDIEEYEQQKEQAEKLKNISKRNMKVNHE